MINHDVNAFGGISKGKDYSHRCDPSRNTLDKSMTCRGVTLTVYGAAAVGAALDRLYTHCDRKNQKQFVIQVLVIVMKNRMTMEAKKRRMS